jgi:hypothetical protein
MITMREIIFIALLCVLIGGIYGGAKAVRKGKNIWTGNEVAKGRNVWSLKNTPK